MPESELHCYDTDQRRTQYMINLSASLLTVVGCVFIVVVYVRFREIRIFAFKLVAILAVFDMLHSVAFMFPTYVLEDDARCYIQAVLISFSSLSGILWTGCIALTLYLSVIREVVELRQYFRWSLGTTVVLSLLAATLPFTTDSYGPGEGWCWINENGSAVDIAWSLSTFYIPLWLIFLLNVFIYVRVIIEINRHMGSIDDEGTARKRLLRRLIVYPSILVIGFVPVTIKRFYQFFNSCSPVELFYISGFFSSSIGWMNAMAYGFNATVRECLQRCCDTDEDLVSSPLTNRHSTL